MAAVTAPAMAGSATADITEAIWAAAEATAVMAAATDKAMAGADGHNGHGHRWGHYHGGRWHYGYGGTVIVDGGYPVYGGSYAVTGTAPAPSCSCLAKDYLQDGSVRFVDRCTNEAAINPAPRG